jgi:cob(I)alamin adenosyltransferase
MIKSQVTTGRGDGGDTSALDGQSYSKSHPIMECVGTVDELRAQTGVLRIAILEHQPADREPIAEFLLWLIGRYFLIGSSCSDAENRHPERHPHKLTAEDVAKLEAEQLRLENLAQLPRAFILTASTPLAAQADLACAVARRLERQCVRLKEAVPGFDAALILVFLNRLSDCLFVLARYIEHGKHITV